jgi:hypothetical protein
MATQPSCWSGIVGGRLSEGSTVACAWHWALREKSAGGGTVPIDDLGISAQADTTTLARVDTAGRSMNMWRIPRMIQRRMGYGIVPRNRLSGGEPLRTLGCAKQVIERTHYDEPVAVNNMRIDHGRVQVLVAEDPTNFVQAALAHPGTAALIALKASSSLSA